MHLGNLYSLNENTGEQGMVPLEILELKIDLGKVSSDFTKISKKHSVEFKQLEQDVSKVQIGYYRVLGDRIPVQASEIMLLKDNVVYLSSIFSDGWCQWYIVLVLTLV